MNNSIIILSCCIIMACSSAAFSEDAGWSNRLLESGVEIKVEGLPGIEFIKKKIDDSTVEVTMINNSDSSISYYGSDGMAQIYYRKMIDNELKDTGYDWCGTGKKTQIIMVGKSAVVYSGNEEFQRYMIVKYKKKQHLVKMD